MKELVQLEKHWQEFGNKHVQIVVVSIEGPDETKATQADFPHLLVVSDAKRQLTDVVAALHPASAPDGGDTIAPTTLLIGGNGVVRWTFRPDRVFDRLTPEQVLTAIDQNMQAY